MPCGTWHWSSAGSPGVSVLAPSGRPSSAGTSPTAARTCRGWPTCRPRARSRCSASSTAPTTTGGTLSIPPRHPPSVSVLGCPYHFLAKPFRSASRHAGGLKCDCRSLDGFSQIGGLRARQARRRRDLIHKLTTDLAKNHGWVAVEDLRVKGMTKSARGTTEEPGSLRPCRACRSQRRTKHPQPCRRAGGPQHAQSPSGGEAVEPYA